MILKSDVLSTLLVAGGKPGAVDPLIIVPMPDPDAVRQEGTASIDLRLGTWFAHSKQAQTGYLPLGESVHVSPELTTTTYVPFGGRYILHPQSFVLAVTLEWLSLPQNIAAYVIGKSSWGRHGLIIATATGVHPGYKGCLTLELTNVGEIPIEIKPGVKICQLFMHRVESNAPLSVCSDFGGLRRPTVRPIRLDPYAEKLSIAYESRSL